MILMPRNDIYLSFDMTISQKLTEQVAMASYLVRVRSESLSKIRNIANVVIHIRHGRLEVKLTVIARFVVGLMRVVEVELQISQRLINLKNREALILSELVETRRYCS